MAVMADRWWGGGGMTNGQSIIQEPQVSSLCAPREGSYSPNPVVFRQPIFKFEIMCFCNMKMSYSSFLG